MKGRPRQNLSDVNVIASGYKCSASERWRLTRHLNKDELTYRRDSSGGMITDSGKGHSGARLVLYVHRNGFQGKNRLLIALIMPSVTTPVQQLFEELCPLYLKTYSSKFFAILHTRIILNHSGL